MKHIVSSSLASLLVVVTSLCVGQRNNIWCFGHEAGIDFSTPGNPNPMASHLVTRGSCATISDYSGQLLFTAAPDTDWLSTGYQFNFEINRPDGTVMPNGDSLAGAGWYYETTIIPFPDDTNQYYVFNIGVTTTYGLYYHIVDMSLDSGKGEVTQKNIQLLNVRMVDCLLAVKHGNGRDWWVMVRESPVSFPNTNNTWYVYYVSPSGITDIGVQNVGTLNGTNSGRLAYDTTSNRICFVNSLYMVELYDFDRCTGLVSNPINIESQSYTQPTNWNWSCEFTPSGQYLYVSTWRSNDSSYLWQFDTWAANIATSKTLLWQTNYPVYYTIGQLKRAPDSKIYLTCAWVDPLGGNNYPYDSTEYYTENMNLSVINSPDLPGAACDFQPYSFYLGGKRTYWGLPNNPDYDLGPLVGSPCDTLVSTSEILPTHTTPELYVYYTPAWQSAFINAQHLSGNRYVLEVYDAMGRQIIRESSTLHPPYYTKNLNCSGYTKGMYVVRLQTEKEKLVRRFVVE